MKLNLECIPCVARQVVEAASMATVDDSLREQVVRVALARVSTLPFDAPPPVMGMEIHRIVRKLVGDVDPYRQLKVTYNQRALELYPWMKQKVRGSTDPLRTAALLAIAGNMIDFGIASCGDAIHLHEIVEETLRRPPAIDHFELFRYALREARSILYVTDNAGEIVFDRVLIEEIPDHGRRVIVAVKGQSVLNDATMEDARDGGLTGVVQVIDNGSDAPGTLIAHCSPLFVETLSGADMVISKGQGNFESLSRETSSEENLPQDPVSFFLLKAKCRVIARHLGVRRGDSILKKDG